MSLAKELLADYVRYTAWASTTLLDACAALTEEELRYDLHTAYPTVWATLVHIYQADSMWWSRIQEKRISSLSTFEPGQSLEDLRARWLVLLDELTAFAGSRSEEEWQAQVRYHNTRGEAFEQPLWQVMMHMVNHATLHRGQILAMFRQLDRVPTSVDLIHYCRRPGNAG